jgi:hypothetical protein
VTVKVLAVIALAVGALVLSASSSTAGAAGVSHRPAGFAPYIPHLRHVAAGSRFSPTKRRTKKMTGLKCVSACSAYESTIDQYFTDVAAASVANATDNVYSVATQYSGISYSETFAGSIVDEHPFPTTNTCHDAAMGFHDTYCVTDLQLRTEIARMIQAHQWPVASQTTLYFIFTPANVGVCQRAGNASATNACTTNVFCAYHNGSPTTFLYAVEPDAAAIKGSDPPHPCDTGQAPAGNGADATLNTVSHEQNEAITDPFPGQGWMSNDTYTPEIGDLCAYDFGAPGTEYNQTINGHNYYLQLEYSNSANANTGGCVPYLGGPVTPPSDPNDGVGPLVYQGQQPGNVMTTNTVYAIYWVPAAPVNKSLPTISGTTKAGKTLKASHGSWSNAPKYTYRWLRCSSGATSCKSITKATNASYTLVSDDVHHRIEVRVTATNAVGKASATSAPTNTVTK